MNRFNIGLPIRLSAIISGAAAFGLVAATLIGCSSGQIAQTAGQASGVNGTAGTLHDLALRNVHIQASQNGDFLRPGQTVDLVLVVGNQSPDNSDRLVDISSDIGPVTVTGDEVLPAGGALLIGTPISQTAAPLDSLGNTKSAEATVALTKPISNGLTYNFTFDFERSGQISLAVPISAGAVPQSGSAD